MGWPWTRKTTNQTSNRSNLTHNTIQPSLLEHKYTPRSPERQRFFKKFAEEIVNVWAPKPNNPVNQYVERNYETEASSYLRKLYLELNQKNDQNFINKKLQEFQRTISTVPLSSEAKQIVLSKLRKLKIYNQMLRNTKNTRNQRTRSQSRSFSNETNVSDTLSVASTSSLPSLRQLRNELGPIVLPPRHTRRRRLQGRVIRPNLNRLSPATV